VHNVTHRMKGDTLIITVDMGQQAIDAAPTVRPKNHLAAFSMLLARDEETAGMPMRDLQIIALLVAHNTPLAVGQVATMLDLSHPYVGRVADKLVTQGLLARSEDPTDRRIALLEPTRAGRALDQRVQGHYASA
jgi:DNA-binding MarR family transcriptional regulator